MNRFHPNPDNAPFLFKPYDKMMPGMRVLIAAANSHVINGNMKTIDEIRVTDTSKRSKYRQTDDKKPIKKGRNTYCVAERMGRLRGYLTAAVPYCGEHTYDASLVGANQGSWKYDNVTQQLILETVTQDTVYAADKKFGSIRLIDIMRQHPNRYHNAGIYGPVDKRKACLPKGLFAEAWFQTLLKNMPRGSFFGLQCRNMHLIIWKGL